MLSNTDFASLLKAEPESFQKSDVHRKDRFDLSQVKAWDKQNQFQAKKKQKPFTHNSKGSSDQQTSADEETKYRDRALERRKYSKPAEAADLEAIAANLSAEQTKFLGGDIEHTHLVKGLDFALLRKNRTLEDVTREPKNATTERKLDANSIRTTTKVGAGIVDVLWRKRSTKIPSANRKPLEGLAFEFNLSTESEIPMTISGRNNLWLDDEPTVRCIADSSTIQRLCGILKNQRDSDIVRDTNKKRKKSNSSAPSHVMPKIDTFSIYDDIDLYKPSSASSGVNTETTTLRDELRAPPIPPTMILAGGHQAEGEEVGVASGDTTSAKGIFSGIRPLSSSLPPVSSSDSVSPNLLDSVKSVIGAAKAKEQALLARAASALTAGRGVGGIEGGPAKAQSRVGDFLSRQSGSDDYNLYPDTTEGGEVMYGSDEEEASEIKKKKPKLGSVNSGGRSHTDAGTMKSTSGINRAARRAAAGKNTH